MTFFHYIQARGIIRYEHGGTGGEKGTLQHFPRLETLAPARAGHATSLDKNRPS